MQGLHGWDPAAPVVVPSASVTVDGTVVTASSVRVSRRIAADAPGRVGAGGALVAATGRADLAAPGGTVSQGVSTPWSRSGSWPPAVGHPVTVGMGGEGVGEVMVLSGAVEHAWGSAASGRVEVGLVDGVDRLHRSVSLDPVAGHMPPRVDGRTVGRYCQMNALWLTDHILRRCGFYATMPNGPGAVISATMFGSSWPEVGTLDTSISTVPGVAHPYAVPAPWGLGVESVDAYYLPAGPARSLDSGPLELVQHLPDATSPWLRAMLGATEVRLAATVSTVMAQVVHDGTTTTVAAAARAATTRVGMLRATTSGTTLTLEVRTDTGSVATGTYTMPTGMAEEPLTGVRAYAVPPRRIGHVIARWPGSTAFAGLHDAPTARFRLGLLPASTTLYLIPGIVDRDALSLLTEQARALAAAMWLDETGTLTWADRAWLSTTTPIARTLTATHDLLDLTWTHDHRDTASTVTVDWTSIAFRRSLAHRITVWEGPGSTLEDTTYEHVLHPGPGIDWLDVDTTVALLPEDTIYALNRLTGTMLGAATTDEDGAESWVSKGIFDGVTMRHVDPRTWVLTYAATPPAGEQVSGRVPATPGSLGAWPGRYGDRLPVVRARAVAERVAESTPSILTGPTAAPALVHDAGWHIQRQVAAQDLADFIAGYATNPSPLLESVPVVYDPRLQLGDAVQVVDDAATRLRVTGRIVGIDTTVTAGGATQTLDIRVHVVERLDVTLGQYDTVWSAAPLSARDTQWGTDTLAAFDTDPLRRT